MGNPNVGIQGVNSSGKLKRVLTDNTGRLLIGASGAGYVSFNVLTTTAPAYAIGDSVGAEVMITPPDLTPATTYRLESLALLDPAVQSANLEILFFKATGSSTDNAPYTWLSAAKSNFLGGIEIAAGDWKTVAGVQVATLTNLGLVLITDVPNTAFFMVVNALNTPNFGNGFLFVNVGVSRIG